MSVADRHGIALAGNWIVDRIKRVDRYPAQDALATIESVSECNGGAPYNVTCDLLKLGATFPLWAIGEVGRDASGEAIGAFLEKENVNSEFLSYHPTAGTSFTDVMAVGATGRRTFFHYRGANAAFHGADVEFDRVPARHLHLGYLLLLDAMDATDAEFGTVAGHFLARASQAGLTTSLDLVSEDSDRFARVVLPTLPHVDLLFANEFELSRTTGIEIGDEPPDALVAAAARVLFDHGLRREVILHTPRVAISVRAGGDLVRQPAVRVPQARIAGAVGAGDAFAAGFLLARHGESSTADALRLGVSAAAACVTDATTSGGLRSAADCLDLADQWGFHGSA